MPSSDGSLSFVTPMSVSGPDLRRPFYRVSFSMERRGADKKSPKDASHEPLNQRLSRTIFAPLLTAILSYR